ncbi:MAG: DUF4097 family beta strand repeat-containing protein [Pyrinomonadaceae bacterium]
MSLFAAIPMIVRAQPSLPEPPSRVYGVSKKDPLPVLAPMTGGDTSEKSVTVDKNVNLSLCVTQGTVKVNGWNRNELRVFVNDGSNFSYRVLQRNAKTNDPVWLMIVGAEEKGKVAPPGECLRGGEIEIDAPVGSTINIKGRETTTTVDLVKRLNISTIGGNISARNISNGITANANQGDITVEESEGGMILDTTTGNILVFNAGPSEIGDTFRAKTNSGAISLQKVLHRQIEANSVSGSVAYNGDILSGGSYSLTTSKGSISLSLNANISCRISATYGFGNFRSEIPIDTETDNISPGPIKTIVGKLGEGGEASIKLSTNNGSIVIKKL